MNNMNKKNRTEITPELRTRIGKVRQKARAYLVKTEVIQFRLDENTYDNLFRIAERIQKPVGTLVREWVTEKVKQELLTKKERNKFENVEVATIGDVLALQKQIDELRKQTQ